MYFADGLESNSTKHYEYVISQPRNEFTEQALARLSQVYLKAKDYDKAIPVLTRLENEADYPQNITYAQSNLMKAYYEKQNYTKAVVYADKVLANEKTDDRIKSDAQIIIARSAIKNNDEVKAKKAYAEGEAKPEVFRTAGGKTFRNVPKFEEKMKGLQSVPEHRLVEADMGSTPNQPR